MIAPLALMAALLTGGGLAAAQPARGAGADTAFETTARTAFAASGAPGLSIAVAAREGAPRVWVLGVRRLGRPAPVEAGDPFHLASITKPLSATLIAGLVESGAMTWDETPAQVWPDQAEKMDARAARVTLRQLLEHRSGLAAYTDLGEIAAAPRFPGDGRGQRAAFARWLLARRPSFKAGDFHYSNAGYGIAAAMAEAAAGRRWEDLMAERIFQPLSMTSCGFGWPAARDPLWPSGHYYQGARFKPQDLTDGYAVRPFLAPAEDVSCDAGDLARFGQAWLKGLAGEAGLMKPLSFQAMVARPIDGQGVGWSVGAGAIFHLGGAGTFHGALFVLPDRNLTVAVIANAGQGRPGSAVLNRVLLAAIAAYGTAPN